MAVSKVFEPYNKGNRPVKQRSSTLATIEETPEETIEETTQETPEKTLRNSTQEIFLQSTVADNFTREEIHQSFSQAATCGSNSFTEKDLEENSSSLSPKQISKLRRRIDCHIIPACAALYLFCFLDRGNIGNAQIAGMRVDLAMSDHDYSFALVIFYISYCLCEAPANMILKRFTTPKVFLPLNCILWGLCVLLMAFARSKQVICVLRFFLGMFEASMMPGCAYYLSMWYRPSELSFRIALFFSAATVAGAFSGIFAWAIMKLGPLGILNPWMNIFLIEGGLTIIAGVICYFFIYNDPSKARFLNDEEKISWTEYLKEGKQDEEEEKTGFKFCHIKNSVFHWRVWAMAIVGLGSIVPIYAFSYFLPTLMSSLFKVSATKAQILSAPPYVFGCIITLLASYFSDKFKSRFLCIFLTIIVLTVPGFALAATQTNPGTAYFGVFLAAAGQFAPWPAMITWNANNIANSYTRSIAMGIQIGVASTGGVIASYIYRTKDAPRYIFGHMIALIIVSFSALLSGCLAIYFQHVNTKREKYLELHPDVRKLGPKHFAHMETESPFFRYQL